MDTAYKRFKETLVVRRDQVRAQCWFWHPWGRWRVTSEKNIGYTTKAGVRITTGVWIMQQRVCERCCKLQVESLQKEIE